MATNTKKYTDLEILELLSSHSDSELEKDTKKVKVKSKRKQVGRSSESNQDQASDTENIFNPAPNILLQKLTRRKDSVSLRIKLRRSTEQSMYKIDTDSEPERPIRKSRATVLKSLESKTSNVQSDDSNSGDKTISTKKKIRNVSPAVTQDENDTPERRSRVRRPPLRLSYYHCGILPSLNTSINTPELRNRRSINYNDDKLRITTTNENFKTAGSRKSAPKKSKEYISDSSTTTNNSETPKKSSVTNNKRNRTLSAIENESDSDGLSISRRVTASKKLSTNKIEKDNSSDRNSNEKGTPVKISSVKKTIVDKAEGNNYVDSNFNKKINTPDKKSLAKSESDGFIATKVDSSKKSVTLKIEKNNIVDRNADTKTNTQEKGKSVKAESGKVTAVKVTRTISKISKELETVSITSSDESDDKDKYSVEKNKRRKNTPKKKDAASPAKKRNTLKETVNVELPLDESQLKTPKRRAIKHSNLTPSIINRKNALVKPATPLQEARSRLHVSAVPKSLPCREEEFNEIFTFLKGKLLDKSGGCIYISGVPGTGKTATVNEVVRCLQKLTMKKELDNFAYIAINAMKLTEPRQAYVQVLKQLSGQTVPWQQAYEALEKTFSKANAKMTLLLVDELDYLCTKRQDVVYNLLDWPSKRSAKLVVITIANTMDLPERVLSGRVSSRLGLTRLTFQPYNYKQLQEIITARLKDFDSFRSEAIQLVSRKIAALSGDARRALDICRRAMEIAESSGTERISISDVTQAIAEMITSPKIQAIKFCSEMEQIFLRGVAGEVHRTALEEVPFANAYMQLQSLCSIDGIKIPTITEVLAICRRLAATKLLVCGHSRNDITQKIYLNVSTDDVHYAFQKVD